MVKTFTKIIAVGRAEGAAKFPVLAPLRCSTSRVCTAAALAPPLLRVCKCSPRHMRTLAIEYVSTGSVLTCALTSTEVSALRYIQVSLARRTRPDQMPGWVHSGLVWVRPDGPGSGLVSRHARMNQMSGLARMRPDAGCPDVARAVSRMPRCPGNPDGARPALCPASPDASS